MFFRVVFRFIVILFEVIWLNIGVNRLIVFGFLIVKLLLNVLMIFLFVLLFIFNVIDNYLIVFIV